MKLFLLFLSIPVIEIALFIEIGGWLGLWPTLGIVVLTALIGSYLVRSELPRGLNRILNIRNHIHELTTALANTIAVGIGGILLLTPGFLTDALGLALLVPASRHFLIHMAIRFVSNSDVHASFHHRSDVPEDVIDAEARDVGNAEARKESLSDR